MKRDKRPPTPDRHRLSAVGGRLFARLAISVVVLGAFFLRAYRLADKSIWWDEGWCVWLSQKDWAWIALRTAADEHPPLHYWLLHVWNFIAGTSAFAGRFVSLAFGVLTIALLYRIGKKVGGTWVGVLAALFLTTSRFHIWWSQDIKNYTPSIFFAFVAVWFALKIISDFKFQISDSKRAHPQSEIYNLKSEIYYALFAALAMWTHYLAALVLLALNLYLLIFFVRAFQVSGFKFSNWLVGSLRNWFVGNLLAAALFAPWMYLYLQNAATWSAAPTFDFAVFLKLVATVLPLGVTTNIENYFWLTIALTTLALVPVLHVAYCVFRKRTLNTVYCSLFTVPLSPVLLFTLIVVFPPLLVYALALTPAAFFAPKIQARYLLVLAPAYAMLLAFGVTILSRLSRLFAVFAILVVLLANAFVLNDYYADRYLRDDYATLANTVNASARQGDLVLLDTDQEWPTFLYYLRAPLDWLGVPNGKAMTRDDADALVRRALNRNQAIWLVAIPDALATDPQKWLEARIAQELPKQLERPVGDKRLALYAREPRDGVRIAPENFAPQFSRAEQFGDALQLLGFDLPTRELNAGDTVRVTTYWRAPNPATTTLRLTGLITTTLQMPPSNLLRYENEFDIPPNARGEFPLVVGNSELAKIFVMPRLTLAQVGAIPQRADARLGDAIHFAGYDLPQTQFRAGETISLTLYWRAVRHVATSYTVFVHLVGAQFNPKQNNPLWGQVDRLPREGKSPTTVWQADEIIADAYRVPIDHAAPPGTYQIVIGLYDAATGARLPTDVGDSITVAEIQIVP